MSRAARLVGRHWFAPAFAAVLAAVWMLARTPLFMGAGGEAALLIDLCLTAPALYALCYARQQPWPRTLLRALAIACLGVWLASWLIPAHEQQLLPQLAPLRWAGVALLALFELRLVAAAVRIAFSATGTAEQVQAASGAPPWIAKIMLWEARLWRGVWRFLRGTSSREP